MHKVLESSAENMEQLRALVALPEGSGSSLSSHMVHNMVCHSTSRGTAALFGTLSGIRHAQSAQM